MICINFIYVNYYKYLFILGFDGIVFPGDMPSRNYASSSSTRGNGSETFNAYNNVPMGAMYHQGFLFITIPRRRSGVPSTLNVINTKTTTSNSPQLKPFPSVKENELQVITSYLIIVSTINKFLIKCILRKTCKPIQIA